MNLVTRAQWGARPPRNRTPLNPTGATAHTVDQVTFQGQFFLDVPGLAP